MIYGNNKATLMTSYDQIIAECHIAEHAGRLSHDSISKITEDSYEDFLTKMIKLGHTSVLEHINISFLIETSRSCSHEIVRHRHCAFTEQSTRYLDFSKGIPIVYANSIEDLKTEIVEDSTRYAQLAYNSLLSWGGSKDMARELLPNCTYTKVMMTTNLREWRHFIKLRKSKQAHEVIRDIALKVENSLMEVIPWAL